MDNQPGIKKLNKSEHDDIFTTYNELTFAIDDYIKELKKINLPLPTSSAISKEDVIVVYDIIKEVIDSIEEFVKSDLIEEAKSIIDQSLLLLNEYEIVLNALPIIKEKMNKKNKIDKSILAKQLRLALLEHKCNIVLLIEVNYEESDRVIKEIIEMQNELQLPPKCLNKYLYYMAIVKFNINNYPRAKFYAEEGIELLNKEDNDKNIRMISYLFELLAIINTYEGNLTEAIESYQKAYYLNLGKYGSDNIYTMYYQKKCEIEKQKVNLSSISLSSNEDNLKKKEKQTQRPKEKEEDKYFLYQMTFCKGIVHKGKTETYAFKIPTTELYEPFMISVYALDKKEEKDIYSSRLFISNIFFDKEKMMRYYIKAKSENINFYTDETLNKILRTISLEKENILLSDMNLVKCIFKFDSAKKSNKKRH